MTIVLACREEQTGSLPPALVDRAELRIVVEPLDVAQTRDYLQTQLAGQRELVPSFDLTATQTLHALTGGLPRRLNQLAHLVLLATADSGQNSIDAATIEGVYRELSPRAFTVPARP